MPGTGCPLMWNDYFFFAAFFFAGFFFPPGFPPGGIEPSLDTTYPGASVASSPTGVKGPTQSAAPAANEKNPHGPGLSCPNRAGNVEEGVGLGDECDDQAPIGSCD